VADRDSHINQAKHNKACANLLLEKSPEYRDWAITAAFYAAVHLAEACFTSHDSILHTDTASDRGEKEGMHGYRARKVRELAPDAYVSYRKLREASSNVRYLTKLGSGGKQIAVDYYDESAARILIQGDLQKILTELEKAFGVNLK